MQPSGVPQPLAPSDGVLPMVSFRWCLSNNPWHQSSPGLLLILIWFPISGGSPPSGSNRIWREEKARRSPWLLSALHRCFGPR